MEGLPSAGNAAYSDICEYSEQRMGNPQWKGFPQIRRYSRINQRFPNYLISPFITKLSESSKSYYFDIQPQRPILYIVQV